MESKHFLGYCGYRSDNTPVTRFNYNFDGAHTGIFDEFSGVCRHNHDLFPSYHLPDA
jgi:hypothetical protein